MVVASVLIFKCFADSPLAVGFDIMLGTYTVIVPNVAPGPYQILRKRHVLPVSLRMSINLRVPFFRKKKTVFGDSGNTGQVFQIQ